jgi:Tfp pilus assembly protein PilZ
MRRLPGGDPLVPDRDQDRRQGQRVTSSRQARLRCGDLTLYGDVADVGSGGVFLATNLLIEVGEQGLLTLEPPPGERPRPTEGATVRVVWTRPYTHPLGAGIGLKFEMNDKPSERRALEMVIELLG